MSRFIFQLYGGTELGMSPLQFKIMCTELLGEDKLKKLEEGGEEGEHSRMIKLIEHFIDMNQLNEAGGGSTHKSHAHKTRRSSMRKTGHKSHTHKSHKSHHHKSHKSHKDHKSHRHAEEDLNHDSESSHPETLEEDSTPAGDHGGCNLIILMDEKSSEPIIKFKFFVKAERKLRGEGIYHAAIESQNAFRSCVMGSDYWGSHIESLNELVYGRDLWNMMDVFNFAICGTSMPENYHDLNFEDAEEVKARRKTKLINKEAEKVSLKEAERLLSNEQSNNERSGVFERRKKRKKKRGEENYQYLHYGIATTLHMQFVKGTDASRMGPGPGGLNPYLILSEMPESMRVAFEKHDMTMLRQLESGSDKKVDKVKFKIWINKAEDAGLWVSNRESGEKGPVGSRGSKFGGMKT